MVTCLSDGSLKHSSPSEQAKDSLRNGSVQMSPGLTWLEPSRYQGEGEWEDSPSFLGHTSIAGNPQVTHAHYLAAAAYHMAHALRMERRGLVYGAEQIRLLAQRAMEQAGEEESR